MHVYVCMFVNVVSGVVQWGRVEIQRWGRNMWVGMWTSTKAH